MADKDKKTQAIIIKKISGGGHAAHGGAWKVAFADFMTAMMCFFLVMWLMGSDEETKAAIAAYFNNVNSTEKGATPDTSAIMPAGSKIGEGKEIIQGLAGANPDDLTQNPIARAMNEGVQANQEVIEIAQEIFDGQVFAPDVNVDYLRFSVPSKMLFSENSTLLSGDGVKYLEKLGRLFKSFDGFVEIRNHTEDTSSKKYEFTMARSESLLNHLVRSKWVAENRIRPYGSGNAEPYTRQPQSESHYNKNERIEFVLRREAQAK